MLYLLSLITIVVKGGQELIRKLPEKELNCGHDLKAWLAGMGLSTNLLSQTMHEPANSDTQTQTAHATVHQLMYR